MTANQQPSIIRMAHPTDADGISELLHEMHAETGMGRLDEDRVRYTIATGIARQGGVVGVVRGDDGHIEASIGLFIGNNWYSQDPHLFDLWAYVGVPYRKSTHAKSLIGFAKSAATTLNLPLMMTVIANGQTARKERLFERQLPKAGSLFLFNAQQTPEIHA